MFSGLTEIWTRFNFDESTIKMELEKLGGLIERAVKASFIEVINRHPDIYAFALYSDENCESLGVTANTLTYWAEAKIEYEEDDTSFYSKYAFEEWDYSLTDETDNFSRINKSLTKNFTNTSLDTPAQQQQFVKFRDDFYDTCIGVMLKLRQSDFFKANGGDDIFITFGATEYEFPYLKQNSIVKSLNDNRYIEEYLRWRETLPE